MKRITEAHGPRIMEEVFGERRGKRLVQNGFNTGAYGSQREVWDSYCAVIAGDGGSGHIHPVIDRQMTLRECARVNYINALDIQVHASIDPEPFGRVLLEAMALSKPLVASNGGAVPEIVVHEHTGLLFEPGNPTALAAALRTLLADRPRAAAMGAAGRARLLAEFSIRHNVELTQALYERVLNKQDRMNS
jgi:glycosyltransferase involved in cell wall biosynthesis